MIVEVLDLPEEVVAITVALRENSAIFWRQRAQGKAGDLEWVMIRILVISLSPAATAVSMAFISAWVVWVIVALSTLQPA